MQEERQLAAAKAAEIERQAKLEADAALATASAAKEELHSPASEDQHGRTKFGNAVMLALACLLALLACLLLISLGLRLDSCVQCLQPISIPQFQSVLPQCAERTPLMIVAAEVRPSWMSPRQSRQCPRRLAVSMYLQHFIVYQNLVPGR